MQRRYPRPSAEGEYTRERLFGEAYAQAEGGSATLAAAILAIAVFLLIATYSARQVTQPTNAAHLLGVGIAATTDIDLLLDEHYAALRDEARTGESELLQLPGYPLEVNLTAEEVNRLDRAGLRQLILSRSAAIVYVEGLDAFDRTGQQSLGVFTVQGFIDQVVGQLTGSTYQRSGQVAAVLLVVVTVAGGAILAMNRGFMRFRAFGTATVLGAAPGMVLTWGGAVVFARLAGGDDPYARDLRAILEAILDTGLRNYLIVLVLGGIVGLTGVLLGMAASRLPEARASDSAVPVAAGLVPARGLRTQGEAGRVDRSSQPQGEVEEPPALADVEAGGDEPGEEQRRTDGGTTEPTGDEGQP